MNITIRQYQAEDLPEILALFRQAVTVLNVKDYTQEQCEAWASSDKRLDRWKNSLDENISFVATAHQRVIGFADMTKQGYLDRLFVHPDYSGKLVGKRLGLALYQEAQKLSLEQITADVSITALPYAKYFGFEIVREQEVDCGGETLKNYHMKKDIKE